MAPKWTAAQQTAIDYRGRGLLLSAAAGSGKTATLTQRIVTLLTEPDSEAEISRMLCVTFTRAAAAELRERIGKALRQALAADPANERLTRQICDLGRAQITTIHSFCLHILRPHAAELGLPAGFSVAQPADVAALARQVMGDILSGEYDNGEEDFFRLADTLGGARDESSLDDVMLYLADVLTAHGMNSDDLAALADRMEGTQQFFASPLGAGTRVQTRRFAAHYQSYFASMMEEFSGDETCSKAFLPMASAHESLCRALLDACDDGDYSAVRRAFAEYNPPARLNTPRKYEAPPEMEYFKAQHTAFKAECKKLREKSFAMTEEETLLSAVRTADICRTSARILRRFYDELAERKRERALVDFGDLESMAAHLLTDAEGNPTDAARSAGQEYDYIFIDEYQDTNRTQDSIFRSLAAGGGARFMVGDIKQSIYRFRGADPAVFADYRRRWPMIGEAEQNPEGSSLFMRENFRCDRSVVDFVNLVSRHIFSAGSIEFTPEDELAFAKLSPDNYSPTPAEVCLLKRETGVSSTEKEAAYVAERIDGLLSGARLADGTPVRPQDIAILLRSPGKDGAAFAEALSRRGIPVQNSTPTSLFEEPEVVLMLSILRAIDNPTRDIDLAAAMKSPVFGFALRDLIRIRRSIAEGSLWDAVRCCGEAEEDSDELSLRCREFVQRLTVLRADARGMAADKLLLRLYDDTDIARLAEEDPERTTTAVRTHLRALYDLARQFENRSQSGGLYSFLQSVEETIEENAAESAPAETADAVQILSIHHSKGLEYPVCFLARTSKSFNKQDTTAAVLFDPAIGAVMRLPDEGGVVMCDTPLRRSVAASILDASIEEEMRVLYVAMTRARERLIVTAVVPDPSAMLEEAALAAVYHTPETIYRAPNFITWILDSLAAARRQMQNISCAVVCLPEQTTTAESDIAAEEQEPNWFHARETEPSEPDPQKVEEYRALFADRFAFAYPHAHLSTVPAKLTVSRLAPDILDETEEPLHTELDRQPAVLREGERNRAPKFLSGKTEWEASFSGTATHVFMQFCNFARLAETDAATECRRLRDAGFLTDAMAEAVRLEEIEGFRQSALFARILRAPLVRREFRFNAALPACDFTRDTVLAEKLRADRTDVIVQGVVDCLFIDENGHAILLDYKTDRLTAWERSHPAAAAQKLCARHGNQLRYYRFVCASMLGRPVDECLIYSLHLGDTVVVPEDGKESYEEI